MNKILAEKTSAVIAGGREFFRNGLWRIRLKDLGGKKGFSVRILRILVVAVKEFKNDNCPLRASALTFYSLLAIVPVLAMVFAVAKGFGFQNLLERELLNHFVGQEEVINKAIEYARSLLAQTRSGLLAGIGAMVLFWAAIKVMNHIEKSFNDIWASPTQRSVGKRVRNYLSIILISPLLLILSGGVSVIISEVSTVTEKIAVLGIFSPLIMFLLQLLPFLFIWCLFTVVYTFMPNTRVSVKSAFIGAIIAGTAFKLLQWGYLFFQMEVSRYNAIYGSFAALPLFFIWLHLSWLVVLFGAELSFAHQKVDEYELAPDIDQISASLKKTFCLSIVHLLVKTFQKGERPLTARQISNRLDIPIRLVNMLLGILADSDLVTRTIPEKGDDIGYQPGRYINDITIAAVLETIDKHGVNELSLDHNREFHVISEAVGRFYDEIRNSRANVVLKDI